MVFLDDLLPCFPALYPCTGIRYAANLADVDFILRRHVLSRKDEEDRFMDKGMLMGQASTHGSLYLFLGRMTSTVILFAGTMILTILIPESDYGLYAIALIPSSLLLMFQDWGIGTALIRTCVQSRAVNTKTDLRNSIMASLAFVFTTGLILTSISLLTANFVALTFFSQPNAAFLIAFASFNILSASISTLAQSVFIGFERMKFVSLILVIQAIVQSGVGPVLVYLGYGAFGAITGYTAGSIIAGTFSLILLYTTIIKNLEKVYTNTFDIFRILKPLLSYGVPLSIGVILGGLLIQLNSFVMASYVKDLSMIGNYRAATNFAVPLTFISVPIITVLFPAFSKIDPRKESRLLRTVFASAVKYATLLMVPTTLALITVSKPLISTLYGVKWSFAPNFLVLIVLTDLLVVFGSIGVTGLLNAMGNTKTIMKMYILTFTIGIPLSLALIPSWGINGMIISSLLSGLPSLFVGLYLVWKKYGAKIDFKAQARILAASLLTTASTYLFLQVFPGANWMQLALGLIVFASVFLISAPLFGAIRLQDIRNLRGMFSGLGTVARILELPLVTIQNIIDILRKSKELPSSTAK